MGDRSKDAAISHENELRIQLFYSSDAVTVEIHERSQKSRNLSKKFAFLTPTNCWTLTTTTSI